MTEKINLGVILFPLKPTKTENKKHKKHSHSFRTKSASPCVYSYLIVQALTCDLGCWLIVVELNQEKPLWTW